MAIGSAPIAGHSTIVLLMSAPSAEKPSLKGARLPLAMHVRIHQCDLCTALVYLVTHVLISLIFILLMCLRILPMIAARFSTLTL